MIPRDAAITADLLLLSDHIACNRLPAHAPEVVTKRRFWSMKVTVLTAPRW